jgi:hypothetical protein
LLPKFRRHVLQIVDKLTVSQILRSIAASVVINVWRYEVEPVAKRKRRNNYQRDRYCMTIATMLLRWSEIAIFGNSTFRHSLH